LNAEPVTCFADSRRLTGPNLWLNPAHPCGAVLETGGALAHDAAAHARWADWVTRMCSALGWGVPAQPVVRRAAGGTILAFHAPPDQLMLATDINEWAWELASHLIGPERSTQPFDALHAGWADFEQAQAEFAARAVVAANPTLLALLDAASAHQVPLLIDDELFSLGSGSGSFTGALTPLPTPEQVDWAALHAIPTVLVSGTNGKTTSVRLLAAMAQQAGQRVGYCCTEGVLVNGVEIGAGDYSGPAGARSVLRHPEVDFAVLEVARGGILRRGLALDAARAALLTNISPEHFGEYGIDTVDDLADVKMVLAQALGSTGTLVLNADDPLLLARAGRVACPVALFALDYAHPALQAQRAQGRGCCGGQNGHLLLYWQGQEYDLGPIAAMPLTVGGHAAYNIANCTGAALCAAAMGIAAQDVAQVLARFGRTRHDNPGRLERWDLADVTVLMDYAHNPEGLAGLLTVAQGLRQAGQGGKSGEKSGDKPGNKPGDKPGEKPGGKPAAGRIGLLLGQAGNRSNQAIADLATLAAQFQPEHIVLKDITGYMRGRVAGEVPALLQAQLLASSIAPEQIEIILPEVEAAQALLRWAGPGDVLVLPVHDKASKQAMHATLDALQAAGWQSGMALPDC
jgi:UDP-N-acetylmuramyl tripeptide synthase